MSTEEHKKIAPKTLRVGIITVSTTRTLENDKSGSWISKAAKEKGIDVVFHQVVLDEAEAIKKLSWTLLQQKTRMPLF